MRRLFVPNIVASLLLAAAASRGEIIERVVAKVNGRIITLSDFQSRQLAAAQAARVSPETVPSFLRQHNARILQQAIDEILLLQKAEEAGLKPPAQYLDEVVQSIRKENNLTSDEQFQDALEREGLTIEELRSNIERSITQKMIVQREIEPKIAIGESELAAEYDKLKATDFSKPAAVTLQEILVKAEAGGLGLARELVRRARAGEDFQALARAHSAAPSRANGGEIGQVAEPDMQSELRDLTRTLAAGEVSEPQAVDDGYRIVKIVARAAPSTTPYETAREQIREKLMLERFDREYDTYMEGLRKNAKVELRVREVPLQLSGPLSEGSLLDALDPLVPGSPAEPVSVAPAAPTPAAPAPAASAGAAGDDEIQATPQEKPERLAPPGSATPAPPQEARPPGR